MKVVALIGGTSAPLTYFVNAINNGHQIELLVVENPKKSKPKPTQNSEKQKASFFEKVISYLKFRLDLKKEKKRSEEEKATLNDFHDSLFKGIHNKLSSEIPTLYVDSVNAKEVEEKISQIKPDLIIDHGTTLVKDHIIDLAPLALNLHWGLSPYYRGVMCTNQALLNWDVLNIGVTIHKLAKKIDGGDILGQKRVEITPDDTIAKITSKLSYHGTEVMIKAIQMLRNKEDLHFVKQDFNRGFITRGVNWNPHINSYFRALDEATLRKMIAKPSRGKAPIVEL